jgi:hypothetical protein
MNKFLLLLSFLLLLGCNQYNNAKLLCYGDVEKETNGQQSTLKNQTLILKIKDDNIKIAKSKEFIREWIDVCKKGANASATSDQIYFNIKTCDAKSEPLHLVFEGTYSYKTKKLNITQLDDEMNLTGNFTCQSANLSQIDSK